MRLLAAWWGLGGLSVIALILLDGHGVNSVCVAADFLIIGAQHVLNNFTAASYDTGLRASGVGMEFGVGRVGAILGPDAMFCSLGAAGLLAAACIASLGCAKPAAVMPRPVPASGVVS